MLLKPQGLWEEEDALEDNPVLTGHWLLRWYGNLEVYLLVQKAWVAEWFLRNTLLSCTLA